MGEFETVLREQVAKAAEEYRTARAGDDEAWQQAADVLEDLLRIAAAHGVDVRAALGSAIRDEAER